MFSAAACAFGDLLPFLLEQANALFQPIQSCSSARSPIIAESRIGSVRKHRNRLGFSLQLSILKQFRDMFYGAMVWDPWLIVSQIVCFQCLYYISLGFLLWLLVGTREAGNFTLKYFFDYSVLTTSSVTGWCVIAASLLNALAG